MTPAASSEGLGRDILGAWVSASSVLVVDSDDRVVYATPAFCDLVRLPLDRMLGQDALTFIPERHRQTVRALWADVRNGKSEPWLGLGFRADGSEVEVEANGTVMDHQGRRLLVFAVRDVTERHQQARQAAALAQAAASVAASDSIEAVLDAISECALAGTRALAAWVRLEKEDRVCAWVGAAGVPDVFREHLRSAASEAAADAVRACFIVEEAVATRRVVVYADWRHQMEQALGGTCPLNLPWQPAAFARLMHRGAAVGVLMAIFREGEMPYEAETTFLAALADQAATAAANARLLVAAREKVTLEERQRLARELHDSVAQSLYAIQLGAQTARQRLDGDPAGVAQPIDYVLRLAEASQAEMRALIFELRPESLQTEGLVGALNRQIEAVRARHGFAAPTIASAEPELPIEVKHALHRIAQEALWNTVKHAGARRVDVRLEPDGDWVVLEIADDGVGFDPGGSFPGHLGLRSMHERAQGIGGSLEVVSARGRGTRIAVRVPSAPQSPPPGDGASRSVPQGSRPAA
ncbi:MAG TPA: PAS domain-containing sensor histidine kinase [Candidatus Dormibacteraeota bacterium]|nr:PAS domain-containing sensor histidine kinase [Candidatus Dormibacteraeota bacterium]